MAQFLKKFEFLLVTAAPVFIGNGNVLSKKDFVYIMENKQKMLYFPNLEKMYSSVKNKGTKAVTYFEQGMINPKKTLTDIFTELGLNQHECGGYMLPIDYIQPKLRSGQPRILAVNEFVKNAYGQPYIPGSSLKGVIRTILINTYFSTQNMSDQDKKALLHDIRVSDSNPISMKHLILVQKCDYNPIKQRVNQLEVYREAIKPGVKIKFSITCENDQAIDVMTKFSRLATTYHTLYANKFLNQLNSKYLGKQNSKFPPIYLGGGTGFWTKSWIAKAKPEYYQKKRAPRMLGNGVYKLTRAQPHPHFITEHNTENYYEMGKCIFQIKEQTL